MSQSINSSYTTSPGYVDLVFDMYTACSWYYRADNWGNYTFPQSFFDDFAYYYKFPFEESYPIYYIAIIFTFARYFFEFAIANVS
jgi:hypothetical protein